MTRNGKIALLPKAVQEQLNRRLDDNEPGQKLVLWLNSLPEVQAVIAAEFGGRPIREQNLSEWRKGGYRDWQRHQERRELLRQMQAESADLGVVLNVAQTSVSAGSRDFPVPCPRNAVMDGDEFHRQMSLVLAADLALAVREAMEQTDDPQQRARCLADLAGKIAQLRREESHATRVRVIRQRWERELARAEELKRCDGEFMPGRALLLQRMYIDIFSSGRRQVPAAVENSATTSSIDAASVSPGLEPSHPTQSDLLRPISGAAEPSSTNPAKN